MARYNEILVGRYNRFIQKLFQMKGGPPAPQLSSDISIGMSLFKGVETRYLEAWNRFMGSPTTIGPVAAQNSGFRLRNPSGSNTIAVIEHLILAVDVASFVNFAGGQTGLDFTTVVPAGKTDPRGSGNVCVLSKGTGVSSITDFATMNLQANVSTGQLISNDNQEIPVLPGNVFDVRTAGVNLGLALFIQWRERFLEESERT